MTTKDEAIQQAMEALRFYADGEHEVTLTTVKDGKPINWVSERERLRQDGYTFYVEGCDGEENFVEDGNRAKAALGALTAALAEQQEPDLSGLRPATQEAIRGWLKDGTFVETIIRTQLQQERELMRYEAQTAQREPLADELVGLLEEVRRCFTRDDDLPDELLPRIDAAIERAHGTKP